MGMVMEVDDLPKGTNKRVHTGIKPKLPELQSHTCTTWSLLTPMSIITQYLKSTVLEY
jgi:hypothetical protein